MIVARKHNPRKIRISYPNATPVPLGCKQPKKYKRKRNTILRCYHKEQVYSDRKNYHLNYNKHTNCHILELVSNKGKRKTLVSQILREQNEKLWLYWYLQLVFEISETLKSKKLTTSKMEPFLMFNKSQLLSYHFLHLPQFFVHTFWIFLKTSKLFMGPEK